MFCMVKHSIQALIKEKGDGNKEQNSDTDRKTGAGRP